MKGVLTFKKPHHAKFYFDLGQKADAGTVPPGAYHRMILGAIDKGWATCADAEFVQSLRAEIATDGWRPTKGQKTTTTTTKTPTTGATTMKQKTTVPAGTKAAKMLGAARVKDPSESLNRTKYAIKRPDGNALLYGGREVQTNSEFDLAAVGVFVKTCLRRQGVGVSMSEWEKSLLAELLEKGKWVGSPGDGFEYGGGDGGYIPNARVKALLDDTLSGGIEITPAVFDDAIVVKPLLTGQISPFVDMKPVTGRRVKSGTMQNLSMSWGVPDGTAVTPFDTSALVGPLDTPVYPIQGFIELGRDFENDTPVNIGSLVVEQYGERLKSELDRVVVQGNGVTEPLGIANTTGVTAVNSDQGTAGPPTVSDYEALMFAVPLQYRLLDLSPAFITNDTTYSRAAGIKVGPTDQRRVFGSQQPTLSVGGTMNGPAYSLYGQPVRISPNLSNNKAIFGGLKKYRLYQRLGSQFVVETGGRTLTLANKVLMGVRARFGGQVVDANAFAVMSDCQD